MIFVGEHTSYTHAWIASALESGVRGSVQVLLGESDEFGAPGRWVTNTETELGLVDEAKATVDKWMARWIHVVSGPVPYLLQRI
jgi:hypothetical protein